MSGNPTIDQLPSQSIKVLRAIKKEGEKHMKYFHSTMGAFKYPERRVKAFDTTYYENALPIIDEILTRKNEEV